MKYFKIRKIETRLLLSILSIIKRGLMTIRLSVATNIQVPIAIAIPIIKLPMSNLNEPISNNL